MVLKKEMYCIASKTFPITFYMDGYAKDYLDFDVLATKKECENELQTYDEPDECQILKVKVTFEI